MQTMQAQFNKLHKQLEETRARVGMADEHMKNQTEGARLVALSITGATLELEALMKQLFLCSIHNLPEYEMLHASLAKHLNDISTIANTNFGKDKPLTSGGH